MELLIAIPIFALSYLTVNHFITTNYLKAYTSSLLLNPSAFDNDLPSKLILSAFPKKQVFHSLSLPIPGKDGEEITLGTVIVNRCGIYIICQIHGSGLIENTPTDKWKHMNNGRYTEFDNPFRAQQNARELIEFYTKNIGLGFIKAHSLLIYTDSDLRFTQPSSRSIIKASELTKRLKNMDKLGHLTRSQVNTICKAFSDINNGACAF